jgi:hypothetical protein
MTLKQLKQVVNNFDYDDDTEVVIELTGSTMTNENTVNVKEIFLGFGIGRGKVYVIPEVQLDKIKKEV